MQIFTKITLQILFILVTFSFLACSERRAVTKPKTDAVSVVGPAQKTTGIITARQVLNSLTNALDLDLKSDTTNIQTLLTDYRNLNGSLPKFGDQGTGYTGAMSRLLTNFMMRGCQIAMDNDLRLSNVSDRRIYKFIDINRSITDPANRDNARWESFAKHIAYRFWGEAPEPDELRAITTFITQLRPLAAGSQDTATTQDVAKLTCALVGSSPRALFGAQQM